jgi:hypothetical protein
LITESAAILKALLLNSIYGPEKKFFDTHLASCIWYSNPLFIPGKFLENRVNIDVI